MFLTARAASGTLASCMQDIVVATACIGEDTAIHSMLIKVLDTNSKFKKDLRNVEIVHRVLVMIRMMCVAEFDTETEEQTEEKQAELQQKIITYLVQYNIIAAVQTCLTNYNGSKYKLPQDIMDTAGEICEIMVYYAANFS